MADEKKIKKKKKPTRKQKDLAKEIVANRGKSMSKAMIAVGYSPRTARNPKNVTKSKAWKELIDEAMPEDDVAELHRELRNAGKVEYFQFPSNKNKKAKKITTDEMREIIESVAGCRFIYAKDMGAMGQIAYYVSPDNRTRKDALDMAYKLRGSFAADKIEIFDPYDKMTNSELARKLAKLKGHIIKKKDK